MLSNDGRGIHPTKPDTGPLKYCLADFEFVLIWHKLQVQGEVDNTAKYDPMNYAEYIKETLGVKYCSNLPLVTKIRTFRYCFTYGALAPD